MTASEPAAPPEDLGSAMTALRQIVVRTLRLGVIVSSYALVVALVGYALFHSSGLPLTPIAVSWSVVSDVFTAPSAEGLSLVALIVLALTPLSRVCLSLGYFASLKDRTFTFLTFFVLTVLLASVAIGASY